MITSEKEAVVHLRGIAKTVDVTHSRKTIFPNILCWILDAEINLQLLLY